MRSRRRAISPGTVSPSSRGRAVGGVRLGQQLGDLLLQQHHLFERMTVAHRAVLARVGEDFGPVQREGHLAHAQHAHPRRNFEHLVKAAFEQRAVLPSESADAVVVRMPVRAQQPHRDVLMGEPLDAPAAPDDPPAPSRANPAGETSGCRDRWRRSGRPSCFNPQIQT